MGTTQEPEAVYPDGDEGGTFQKVAGTGEAHLTPGDSPERWCEQG